MDTKNELIDALAELVNQRQKGASYKHDLDAGFTLTTNFMHGPVGIFGTAGAERDVFSTRVRPRGLLSVLPAYPAVNISPITYYLTGITAQSGSEPDTPCETCIKAGNIKSCRQGTAFGLICRETDELDLSAVGQHVNRGEYYDLRLVNDPLLNNSPLWTPPSVPKAFQDVLNREVLARLLTVGAAFEDTLARMIFTGNPAANVGTGYAEYLGLELLVATGHTDILDQTSCPSLDSDIKEFNYNEVEDHAAMLFAYMEMLYRYVRHNAETMGFMPVEWAWVMKDSLFRKLADYWPCVYASSACNATANDVNNNVDGFRQHQMADEMYTQRYLQIDGIRIPVILDDAIPYDISPTAGLVPGQFASDIYLLPFTVVGGRQVLFMEYFDYSASGGMMQAVQDARMTDAYWTDGGRWVWTRRQTDWCIVLKAKIQPRLRLLTPHLAGKIQNVVWSPLQEFRSAFPGDSYFSDGGLTTGSNLPYNYSDLIR